MTGFLLFCAYAVICCLLLGVLYWALNATNLPQPLKVGVVVFLAMIGLIYFLNSGYLPSIGKP